MANANRGGGFRRILVLLALAGVALGAVAAFRAGPPPTIVAATDLPGIGKRTTIEVRVEEPKRGLSDVRVEFLQGDRVELLEARHYTPLEPWAFWGPRTRSDELIVEVGRETLDNLKEDVALDEHHDGRKPGPEHGHRVKRRIDSVLAFEGQLYCRWNCRP